MGNIFSSTDIRGYVGQSLTTEYVWNVGKAFAEWLPEKGAIVVVQAELADEGTAHALTEGILLQGRNVITQSHGDQPKVIAAIMENKAAGGALIEYEKVQNLAVITLFDERGVAIMDSTGLSNISELVDAGNFLPAPAKGELHAA
ncbi:MAG: phosphomannomutase, phosphomannomutase [Candidatus Saccharibacteria bacterium]|nr:phosphomannomutase, phosphomannomutase [Candidatus Saccharibacteria bacterium]